MPKKYFIRQGFSFRLDNGGIVSGGEAIELEDDVAKLHLHKLDVSDPKEPTPAKKPKKAADAASKGGGEAAGADGASAESGADHGSDEQP